jgi:hypothetical protein
MLLPLQDENKKKLLTRKNKLENKMRIKIESSVEVAQVS